MIFGQFIVCHRSVLCPTGISFDDHKVTVHGPQALSPTTAEVKHELDEDLPLKWLRIVITQHSGWIHFLHICSRYGRFMGRLVYSPCLQVLQEPYEDIVCWHEGAVLGNVDLPWMQGRLQVAINYCPDVNVGAAAVMASILFSQRPRERFQSTRQLIIVEGFKRCLLTTGFQSGSLKKSQ